ncbi:MAG: penicillin-binding protein 1C [Desulfuromonadales bacterium GWD2_61_12]|nr:MAG: penicillin-binding protein 1C [Desulfuromonadales bacterium GWC2_61_20]OGR31976.1 MAG: penicillin-binding protein 1C [Desulfuromonadales bacterium GWD2_61_12]HAD03823.1 penicillin-binding protein 1C [Desulfuromonas sp.]HBT82602.1 penicillin-binding protein 1C [Desulfuromonas sp.]
MKPRLRILLVFLLSIGALLAFTTWISLRPLPPSLESPLQAVRKAQLLDRSGIPLSITYDNDWNLSDVVPLHEMPTLLVSAFIAAEDRRFYRHGGVDWLARLHALGQNLVAGRAVRGASTISEQVVRLLHPRPRTVWSRWLEGFEAVALERRFAKERILEFYLNQVPYAARRRGVVQAARSYFDRDLGTLSHGEMLALAVMVRAPARLEPQGHSEELRRRMLRLAEGLVESGTLPAAELEILAGQSFELHKLTLPVQAGHFIRHVSAQPLAPEFSPEGRRDTTLDAGLQSRVQAILDSRLLDLKSRQVGDGAVLVVDYTSGEILAWVNGGGDDPEIRESRIDAILTPRQPGSALKPFVYALALEQGWTAATLIDDSPLASAVGSGLHDYRNYSRQHYGPLRLRDCLGNSLNIPAVRTAEFVGPQRLLESLRRLGFASLTQPADWYGLGLALGNGEVTLFELVQGYAALANGGVVVPLRAVTVATGPPRAAVLSAESASLIANILSDPAARQLEFGRGSLLSLPLQTAVKTGTSTDYRDAWAVGFNHRFAVGVWMGNLDQQPMREITGAIGPALVLRSVFAELARHDEGRRLYLSPRLTARSICRDSGGEAGPDCPSLPEWFAPGTQLRPCSVRHGEARPAAAVTAQAGGLQLLQPTPDLILARDPRIPDALEAFAFELPPGLKIAQTEWRVDGQLVATTGRGIERYLWPLQRGKHTAQARVRFVDGHVDEAAVVSFRVK